MSVPHEKIFLARLVDAVETVVGQRVFANGAVPMKAASPFVSYFCKQTQDMDVSLRGTGECVARTFQVDIFSEQPQGYRDCKDVEALIRAAFKPAGLPGWWYEQQGFEDQRLWVQYCKTENNTDDQRPPAFAEDVGRHALSLNVQVVFGE